MCRSLVKVLALTALTAGLAVASQSSTAQGGQSSSEPITYIPVPGNPFKAISSADGNSIFVSLDEGIGILAKSPEGRWSYVRTVAMSPRPFGMTLTHDGKVLIAAKGSGVAFFDAAKMIAGDERASLGSVNYAKDLGSIEVAVTGDDRFLFVSEERARAITVIDVDRVIHHEPDLKAVVGRIPVGMAPVGLAFSPDQKTLFSTSERAPAEWGWPANSSNEGSKKAPMVAEGTVITIDVALAEKDPPHSVVSKVPSGGSPVRVALSPDGATAYVTVRGANQVFVFDTAKLRSDPEHAKTGTVTVGPSPVGIAVVNGGKDLIVANSNRFAEGTTDQTLSVIDTARIAEGATAVRGTLPAGSFPREIDVTPDGKTLIVTNFGSKNIELVDLTRLDSAIRPPLAAMKCGQAQGLHRTERQRSRQGRP